MKKIIAVAGAIALAACGSGEAEVEEVVEEVEEPAVSAVAGTYTGTTEDGTEWTSVLNPDGTYQDTVGDEVVESGTWTDGDGQTCFTETTAEGEEPAEASCFTVGEVGEDGSVEITDAEGETMTITKAS